MNPTFFEIEGPVLFESRVFKDERGSFFESYNKKMLSELLGTAEFVQDNQSTSKKHVVRGLHFQKPPFAQGKLVRVIKGRVIDVAVDIRNSSPTYGQHIAVELSEENNMNFWVPEGFAHGFVALEDNTVFSYKCTNYYNAESEGSILWNDPDLAINWNVDNPIISEKDNLAQKFTDFSSPF